MTDDGQTLSDISSASCDGPPDERAVCLRCPRGARYPIEGAWEARLSSGTARFTFDGNRWFATSPSDGRQLAYGYYSVEDHALVLNELFVDAAFVVAMCPTSPQGRYRIDHEADRCTELTLVATEDLCDARRAALNNARFTRIEGSP